MTATTLIPRSRVLLGIGLAMGLATTGWAEHQQQSYRLESVHPYKDWTNQTFEIHQPGAKQLRVHFKRIDIEKGFDRLVVLGSRNQVVQTIDGRARNVWSRWVKGDRLRMQLQADHSQTGFGFVTDRYEYTPGPVPEAELFRLGVSGIGDRIQLLPGQHAEFTVQGFDRNGKPITDCEFPIGLAFGDGQAWARLVSQGDNRYRLVAGPKWRQGVKPDLYLSDNRSISCSPFVIDILKPPPVLTRLGIAGIDGRARVRAGQAFGFQLIGYDQYGQPMPRFDFEPRLSFLPAGEFGTIKATGGHKYRFVAGATARKGVKTLITCANGSDLATEFLVDILAPRRVLSRVELDCGPRFSLNAGDSVSFRLIGYDQRGREMPLPRRPAAPTMVLSQSGDFGLELEPLGGQRYRLTTGSRTATGLGVTLCGWPRTEVSTRLTLDILPPVCEIPAPVAERVTVSDVVHGRVSGNVTLDGGFLGMVGFNPFGQELAGYRGFLLGDGAAPLVVYAKPGEFRPRGLQGGSRLRVAGTVKETFWGLRVVVADQVTTA